MKRWGQVLGSACTTPYKGASSAARESEGQKQTTFRCRSVGRVVCAGTGPLRAPEGLAAEWKALKGGLATLGLPLHKFVCRLRPTAPPLLITLSSSAVRTREYNWGANDRSRREAGIVMGQDVQTRLPTQGAWRG